MQAAPPTQAASVQAVPARPAAPAERAPASAPARPVPAPAPAPAQHATSPTQPSRAVPMPQPPHAPVVPAAPSELADVLEAPRSPRVSPMHVVIGLGVVIAGLAGFALVFWFARQEPDPPAAPEAIAVAVTSPPPGTASVAAAPTPAPAMPPPPPAAARASVPTAPRLPFVDPGPMPEEHAGAAAIVDRYRESLARGSRARSRGDLEVALQSYRFAVHLKPRSTEAILGVARTYEDAGQFEDALRWAERARDVELRGIEGRLMVGDLQLELGRHDQAIATWREAQAIAPRERAPEERIRRAEEALAERD